MSTGQRSIPFLRIRSRGRVGPDVFDDLGLARPATIGEMGLVDDLAWHATPQFDPTLVDARVRDFYEHAASYRLDSEVRAARWFTPALWMYSRLARRVGQTDFPFGVELGGSQLTNRIFPIDVGSDTRAWVRTWQTTGSARVLYAAAYSRHAHDDQRYLDIAFPFPTGTLTSVLRFVSGDRGGTELTTDNAPGIDRRDAGIWWAGRRRSIRLPMSEQIRVWPGDAANLPSRIASTGADVVAEHHIRLFGRVILTLYYVAAREARSTTATN